MSTIVSMLQWAALSLPVIFIPAYVSVHRRRNSVETIVAERRVAPPEAARVPQEQTSLKYEAVTGLSDNNEEMCESPGPATYHPCLSQLTEEEQSETVRQKRRSTGRPKAVRGHRRAKIIRQAKARIVTRPAAM